MILDQHLLLVHTLLYTASCLAHRAACICADATWIITAFVLTALCTCSDAAQEAVAEDPKAAKLREMEARLKAWQQQQQQQAAAS